jgi:ATP-binding cassette, sub-family E, member 1
VLLPSCIFINTPFLLLYLALCTDYICCLYGTPSAYGVVTMPFSVREGINIFLAGFVPTENLRFRDEELNFKLATSTGTHHYTPLHYTT